MCLRSPPTVQITYEINRFYCNILVTRRNPKLYLGRRKIEIAVLKMLLCIARERKPRHRPRENLATSMNSLSNFFFSKFSQAYEFTSVIVSHDIRDAPIFEHHLNGNKQTGASSEEKPKAWNAA